MIISIVSILILFESIQAYRLYPLMAFTVYYVFTKPNIFHFPVVMDRQDPHQVYGIKLGASL